MNSKRYIPVLITVALLALIGLQIIWLFLVYKQKEQELKDKTREAILETTKRLQKEEDSKLIIHNMDSLLLTENIIGSDSTDPIRVMVSNIKNKLKIDTIKNQQILEHKMEINDDSTGSTTIVNVGNGQSQKIIISSKSKGKNGSSTNTQSYSYSINNYENAAADHEVKLKENDKKIIEQEKKLEEHILKLEEKEKQLAAKEIENKTDLSKEKEAIQKEKAAIEKQKLAIETAKKTSIKGEYMAQIASIEIQNGKQQIELEKLAASAQSEAQKAQKLAHASQIKIKKLEKKAGELQTLFLKMAVQSNTDFNKVMQNIDFTRLKSIVKEELLKEGITLEPQVAVTSDLGNPQKTKVLFPEMNSDSYFKNSSFVSTPLFASDFASSNVVLEVGFKSTISFLLKRMASLLALSLFITILIGSVMIYLFKRMLSQEKLHAMKNDFINNMTHELKTPIATISLAVDGINNPSVKNNEEKFKNYSNILKEENKKLNDHVERVLQMAMLEKGELILNKKIVGLKLILENCIHNQQLQIQNKKAIVILNAEEDINVSGDEFHLTNAFTNLLDNALKYSGEDCEIIISLNSLGEIRFKDNGIGMDKAIQERVFEKFYRAQGGNLHDVKGFGLGLSYVRSIVEAHEGTIELKSEKNKGSEFIIKLNIQ